MSDLNNRFASISAQVVDEMKTTFGSLWTKLTTEQVAVANQAIAYITEAGINLMSTSDPDQQAVYKRDLAHGYNILANIGAIAEQETKHAVKQAVATVFARASQLLIAAVGALA